MQMWKQRGIFLCGALALLLLCGRTADRAVAADAAVELETEMKYIALTVDDGPRASTTGRLLDGLKERGASATFFLVGNRIAGNEDLIWRMKEEGHQVGNHTWSHVKLQGAGSAAIRSEVEKTDAALRELLGGGGYWLRPPYGLIRQDERELIRVPMVHWSVDPKDWEVLNTPTVVRSVLNTVKPGDIILLHDIYPTSVDAALQIVDALEAQGYWFVTVEELLALNGIQARAGEMYLSAR